MGQPELCVISSEHHYTKMKEGKTLFSSSTQSGSCVGEKSHDVQALSGRQVPVSESWTNEEEHRRK